MKNNERLIQFFDIQLKGKTKARDIEHGLASPRTLDELVKEFQSLHGLNLVRQKLSKNAKQEYVLADIQEHDKYWVLLINVVDADAAHLVTNKLGGGNSDREVIDLDGDRGLESSAHLIIYKEQDKAGKHLALYEQNANIPFSKAMSFVNKLSGIVAKHFHEEYKKPHPSNVKGKFYNIYCVVAFFGHPSDEFYQELKTGIITGIRLTSDMKNVIGFDSNAHTDLIGHEIKMKVSKLAVKLSNGNLGHLNKAIKYAKNLNSPFVRIQFKDATGPGHSATISSDTGQLISGEQYVKKRRIHGFGNSLQTAFPIIHKSIRDKMLELIQQ